MWPCPASSAGPPQPAKLPGVLAQLSPVTAAGQEPGYAPSTGLLPAVSESGIESRSVLYTLNLGWCCSAAAAASCQLALLLALLQLLACSHWSGELQLLPCRKAICCCSLQGDPLSVQIARLANCGFMVAAVVLVYCKARHQQCRGHRSECSEASGHTSHSKYMRERAYGLARLVSGLSKASWRDAQPSDTARASTT
jgi:hypothetical protein